MFTDSSLYKFKWLFMNTKNWKACINAVEGKLNNMFIFYAYFNIIFKNINFIFFKKNLYIYMNSQSKF